MAGRFTKSALRDYLVKRVCGLRDKYNFDMDNGTAQLRDGDKDRAVAYGEMRGALDLIHQIDGGFIHD